MAIAITFDADPQCESQAGLEDNSYANGHTCSLVMTGNGVASAGTP